MASPIETLGPRLWLQCDAGIYTSSNTSTPATANGDRIQLWADQSGGGYDVTQTGLSTLRPTLDTAETHRGRPTIRFASAGLNAMSIPNTLFSGMTSGEVFVTIKRVADPAAADQDSGLWTLNAGSSFHTHYPYTDGVIYDNTFTSARKTVGNPTPSLAAWRVYSVRSAANDWACYLDNTLLYSTATNTVEFPGGVNLAWLGKAWNDTYFLNGWIAELVIFPMALTTQERADVYDQLVNGYTAPSGGGIGGVGVGPYRQWWLPQYNPHTGTMQTSVQKAFAQKQPPKPKPVPPPKPPKPPKPPAPNPAPGPVTPPPNPAPGPLGSPRKPLEDA